MSRDFEDIKDGTVLEPFHLNVIYRELRRLRRMQATPPLTIQGMDSGESSPVIVDWGQSDFTIRLTGNGDADALHDWEEVQWNGTDYETSGVTGLVSDGDGAMELNGLKCPKSDAILRAWRDNYGQVRFRVVRHLGVADADIAASASGTVSVWARQSGTVVDTSLNVTALNWNNLTKVTSGKRVMITPVEDQWAIDYEAC